MYLLKTLSYIVAYLAWGSETCKQSMDVRNHTTPGIWVCNRYKLLEIDDTQANVSAHVYNDTNCITLQLSGLQKIVSYYPISRAIREPMEDRKELLTSPLASNDSAYYKDRPGRPLLFPNRYVWECTESQPRITPARCVLKYKWESYMTVTRRYPRKY